MKLIQEYIIKVIIFAFIFSILTESGIFVSIFLRSKQIYDSTYEDIINKSSNKSYDITIKIGDYTRNIFLRYLTDLKLISKHTLLLDGKMNYGPQNAINRNSKIFNINNNQKEILFANTDILTGKDYLQKMLNDNGNFDYVLKYEEEFKNITNKNEILNHLLNSHQELNTIAFYSPNKTEVEDKLKIKYIISMLKTIYIQRYITKRSNIEYIRFLIFNKDEIYIYPPEAYNKLNIYNFNKIYESSNCLYSSTNDTQHFPLCVYNYLINTIMTEESNYLSIFHEAIKDDRIFSCICLKIPLIKSKPNQAILCIEIDSSKFFNTAHFSNPEIFAFGLFAIFQKNVFPLFYSRKIVFNEFKRVFNDTVSNKYVIDDKQNDALLSLFHYLYFNLTKTAKEHPELNVNFTEIEDEFNIIYNNMMSEIAKFNYDKNYTKLAFSFKKTICQKNYFMDKYECVKDRFEMIIIPLNISFNKLNEDFIEGEDVIDNDFKIFIFSIIGIYSKLNKSKIMRFLMIKLARTVILFLFLTIIILSIFILLINLISEYSLNPINVIIKKLKKININNSKKNNCFIEGNKIVAPNKEMLGLKNIYETMRKTFAIKQVFCIENYLDKHNKEFYNLIQDIDKINIKEICNSYLGFYHYKNEAYNLAENEFHSTIEYIIDNENKVTNGKISEYEDKIKDAIKRSSSVSYLNEFSEFEKIEENLLTIINVKIYKQRFMYLYAMTKFKLGNEIIINSNASFSQNKNKQRNERNKKNYYKDAIKYFNECKNINILLGINQIKIIYSFIMISQCYIQLNNYKDAIININEALSLFFEFSKSFKDYHSKYYNPKIMLFVENNIFHYILFTFDKICNSFNKPCASIWITLEIFETSPFLIGNIHYNIGTFLQNNLEKNKLKLSKIDVKIMKDTILFKEYDKTKKKISKIIQRINVKKININFGNKKLTNMRDSIYTASYNNKSDNKTEKSLFSSVFRREMLTGRISTSFHFKNKNRNKIITLCLSEKILEIVNGLELRDLIIKFYQKFFIMNENDKFSFIQFAYNGKKTIYFKEEQLNYFLLKLQKTKNSFELTDSFVYDSSPFMELYNILDSIIKNNSSTDSTDNIIIMFINSIDIRFTSRKECLNIVEELNKKNTSLFLLTYEEKIKSEKINNIQSFLNGLAEGFFFQIKNYRQLKQIFINISTINYQSNFFGYDFSCLDKEL